MATDERTSNFQGVVCCCLDKEKQVQDTIFDLIDLKNSTIQNDLECYELELKNKYYQANIQLFDFDQSTEKPLESIFDQCHAIILYINGVTSTIEQLDQKISELECVRGEPRILICQGIDEGCDSYKTMMDWSLQNGYELLLTTEEDLQKQVIDSLSAYRWPHRKANDSPQLDGDLMKKLSDFDTLLGKLSVYRDKPELRGDSGDKNIEEIAQILSTLLEDDDDVENFLKDDQEP